PLYYSQNGFRYFYTPKEGWDLEVLHVHTHYFMERKLADYLSTFNLVDKYNHAHVEGVSIPTFQESQTFGPSLSASVFQDGMEISPLLFHHDVCQERLKLPNSGWDVFQYLDAMAQQLRSLALAGTQFCNHASDECLLVTEDDKKIHAVVTDSITIGISWGSVSPLQLQIEARKKDQAVPEGPGYLTQVHDPYCQHHQEELSKQCKAQPCIAHSLPEKEHCENPDHIRAYQIHQPQKHAKLINKLTRCKVAL
ncbi:hypothetical protein CROQUDRAFT_46142, partial [Cronartium quercuum f. sp. fusiforme G11]